MGCPKKRVALAKADYTTRKACARVPILEDIAPNVSGSEPHNPFGPWECGAVSCEAAFSYPVRRSHQGPYRF